jgi:anhydro-N-acetylmuramic acid kinase
VSGRTSDGLYLGLMSGTSMDGIDAALLELRGDPDGLEWRLVHWAAAPYRPEQREAIHGAILAGSADALCSLHADLGEWLAAAARTVCERAEVPLEEVRAIGSHGQTVWHRPPAEGWRGATLQLGDPATIAERTGCDVVSDLRSRDVAAGGHGAPLVPLADRLLFAHPDHPRALQNIGGIGNVTWVPARGEDAAPLAFDTGPGNALIDAAVELCSAGAQTFDRDGYIAERARVDTALLERLMGERYLAMEPPKSTGREEFGRPFVERLAAGYAPDDEEAWGSLVATLTEFTARSIADAYERWIIPRGVGDVVVTGGGARNPVLLRRIRELLDPLPVDDGASLGIDPEAKEAAAFALLAWAHLARVPGNVPTATGAAGPRILGSLTPGMRDGAETGERL